MPAKRTAAVARGGSRSTGRRRSTAPPNSSRSAALTREDIVEAAVGWIDEEGLGSFSMRRFAGSLGISGPALYWHFRSRDDLLGAAADHVLSTVDTSIRRNERWETSVRRVLRSVWRAARAHPGLLDLLRTQPLHGSGAGQRLLQSLLVALRRAGFEPEAAVAHARTLLWTTFGFIRGTAATLERVDGARAGRQLDVRLQLDLSSLDHGSMAAVAECVPYLATLDLDDLFGHTIDTMLAGIVSGA